jgi:hypothetical protein
LQTTLPQAISKDKPLTQKEADKLILRYIVDSLSPISHVEHPSFVALVSSLAPHVKVCSRQTLSRRIRDEDKVMKSGIEEALRSASSICLTADAWTGFKNRRAFMGVTGHVLNDNLRRKSFALACRLFKGSHTYDRIAQLLHKIMKQYGIPVDKVITCVTDNGSNFVKAFREFHVELNSSDQEDELDDSSSDIDQIELFDVMESSNEQTQTNPDVNVAAANVDGNDDGIDEAEGESDDDEMGSDSDTEEQIVLPAHQRCASHTLNLVGCNAPTATAKLNGKYRSLLHSSNGKLSAIWNKVNKQQSNEIISASLGCQLITPVPTRWNSYYDARRSFLLHSVDKIDALCKALELPCFKEVEIAFLKEENRVLTPLAEGLDRLQGHTNPESYMAFLFPTLFQLRHQYSKLTSDQSLKFCSPLAVQILGDISSRFADYFSFSDTTRNATLATVTHPAFKLRWVASENSTTVDSVKQLFIDSLKEYCSLRMQKQSEQQTNVVDGLDSNTLDFFTFMDDSETEHVSSTAMQSHAELEGLQYLKDNDKTLNSLQRYPAVREMFIKYNVALPSSAAVERLFSIGGMLGTAKRNRLKPALFESLLLQRVNSMNSMIIQ